MQLYSKILLPLDGSELSEKILPYASWLTELAPSDVELLRVISPEVIRSQTELHSDRSADEVTSEVKSAAIAHLEGVAQSFGSGVNVRVQTEIGEPPAAILGRADASPDTLIMMSTHGHSGLGRWLLGSVTYATIHGSTNPLFVVRPGKEAPGKVTLDTLLVPLDRSSFAAEVLPHVQELAQTLELKVVLVGVYDPRVHGHIPYMQELDTRMRDSLVTYLEDKARQLESAGVAQVSCLAFRGNAAEEIIRLAEATPNNLIVMQTHLRSGTERSFLGSVANRVVCHSNEPVLLVPFRNQ